MPFYFIVCLEVFRLDVRMLWKSFPTQGSHNTQLCRSGSKLCYPGTEKNERVSGGRAL